MKEKAKKTKSIQLRMTPRMYDFLLKEAEKRDCSVPEAIRYAAKKFYKISYQKLSNRAKAMEFEEVSQ